MSEQRYKSQRKRVPKLGIKIDTVRDWNRTEKKLHGIRMGVFANAAGGFYKHNGRTRHL